VDGNDSPTEIVAWFLELVVAQPAHVTDIARKDDVNVKVRVNSAENRGFTIDTAPADYFLNKKV
jgi:hypothetical protein